MISIGVNGTVAFYVSVILPYYYKIKEDINNYNPKVIYIGAISGFIGFIR